MPTPPTASRRTQLNTLVECGRQFYDRRWMWGTAGNLSLKLKQKPLEIAITPSGVNKGRLSTKDILILKGASQAPGAKGHRPSAETAIHQAIHEAVPECGAVFHVHPIHATVISSFYGHPQQRQMLKVDWFEMMKGVGVGEQEEKGVPIFPNWQDVSRVAEDFRKYLQETPKALPVALIYNHGLTAWGRTPDEARNHLEIMEYVCEYLYLKRLAK